jgi:malate dehydrogenase
MRNGRFNGRILHFHSQKKGFVLVEVQKKNSFRMSTFASEEDMSAFQSSVRVTITGGAGRIAYSLIPLLLNGLVFGEKKIHLTLLDIPQMEEKLRGIKMEIDDSNYHLLQEIVVTTDGNAAFVGAEVVVLLGGFPRLAGMERKDLLLKNAENIKTQALAMNATASEHVKVCVVANPANTNCLVALKTATRIPAENFTCLTRLDEERLRNFCAQKVSQSVGKPIHGTEIQGVYILGNHSTTQVAHISDGIIVHDRHFSYHKVSEHFTDQEYSDLLTKVQNRGAEIIKATQVSSASSAAEAIVKHLRDWVGKGTAEGPFSMGVYSRGNPYGIDEDLVFSFPCVRSFDNLSGYKILPKMHLNERLHSLIHKTEEELKDEKFQISEYLH